MAILPAARASAQTTGAVAPGAPTDFDGDGRADLAIFDFGALDGDAGTWYIVQGGTNFTTAFSVKVFGDIDDWAVVGDFDGDGRTDLALYDILGADAGTWYILQGGTNFTTAFSVVWGENDDTPVAADYDGDGRLDIAVYDSAGADAGTWYILQGGTNFTTAFSVKWGDGGINGVEDHPVPADYDGDGRTDIAVYDRAGIDAGTWYILQGGTGFTTAFSVVWGDGVDEVPVPGDYDGDRRIDLAVFDTTGTDAGTWYILQGGTGFTTAFSVTWGDGTDDAPVPNDYDGDGRLDIAVYEWATDPDQGTVYILQGGTGFTTAFTVKALGGNGDDTVVSRRVPLPFSSGNIF